MLAVLPADFALPPLGYLLGLVAVTGLIAAGLFRARPPVTERLVLALVPWIVVGAGLSALTRLGEVPASAEPLLGTPAVYLTTFALAGGAWLAAIYGPGSASAHRVIAATGGAVLLGVAVLAATAGPVALAWPVAGVIVSTAVAALCWWMLRRRRPHAAAVTGKVGGLVVFGHALDGVSTAIGVDALGFAELTPVSRLVLEAAAALPTAGVIGSGWLFVAVKLVVAAAVVALFADYVREEPSQARLLLAAIAAVGLGPGVHNLLLYALG